MAIFSSLDAAQDIPAPALPTVEHADPVIDLSGPNCRYFTVTLQSTTKRTKPDNTEEIRVLTKVFKIDCDHPTKIEIEVKEQIDGGDNKRVFFITIDPHKRVGSSSETVHPFNNDLDGTVMVDNPVFFEVASAKPKAESQESYETYGLALRRQPNVILYAGHPTVGNVEREIFSKSFGRIWIPEFKNGNWTVLSISSLLKDLLQNVDPLELQLIIVGNHNFKNPANSDQYRIETAKRCNGSSFGFVPADRTDEAKWDQFLIERAKSLRHFVFERPDNITSSPFPTCVFNPRDSFNILTVPAQKINEGESPPDYDTNMPNEGGDFIEPQFWTFLCNLFVDGAGNPDIGRLDALKLRKGLFGAGSTFIWIPITCGLGRLQLQFDTNESEVLTDNSNATNNQVQLDQIKAVLDRFPNLRVRMEGHTDSESAPDYPGNNLQLSEDRANSVRTALENMEVASGRFDTSVGYGAARPNVPNNPLGTPGGTPTNRRVVMRTVSCS